MDTLEIPDEVLTEILETGIIFIGGKKCGKTDGCKWLIKKFLENPKFANVRFRILDTALNWRYKFLKIPYFHLKDDTLEFLDELAKYPQNVIVDVDFRDPSIRQLIESELAYISYDEQKQRKITQQGLVNNWVFYIIEEAQNIIGTYALKKDIGKDWLSMVSDGRNFGLTFGFIGQRAADISPEAVERCQSYLIGTLVGDNNKKKVRAISNKEVMENCTRLGRGEFIFWNGKIATPVKFPKWEFPEKPYPLELKKKESYWGKI